MLRVSGDRETESPASAVAAKLEFLTMTEVALKSGKILTMARLQSAYESICEENNLKSYGSHRKAIKELITQEINGVEFHRPKQVNESERVTIKVTRDCAIQQVEDATSDCARNMKTLYDAALLLRKSISKSKKWSFSGTLDAPSECCPEELYCFFRWVIQGPNSTLSAKEKCDEVHKRATHLAQNTVSMYLTERQVKNKTSTSINVTHEMPEQLAIGLAVHHTSRSKQIINLLHGFGLSVEYNRLLRVETQIERHVIDQVLKNGGVYLPPNIVKGRHVYFAVDNVDFGEDTRDGKRTLHGAAMAIYQKSEKDDEFPELM